MEFSHGGRPCDLNTSVNFSQLSSVSAIIFVLIPPYRHNLAMGNQKQDVLPGSAVEDPDLTKQVGGKRRLSLGKRLVTWIMAGDENLKSIS